MNVKNRKLDIKGSVINIARKGHQDFICLTDIAKYKNAEATGLVISHWLSARYTIEFMGLGGKYTIQVLRLTEYE